MLNTPDFKYICTAKANVNMYKKLLFYILFFISADNLIFAQSLLQRSVIEAGYTRGFVFPHHKEIEYNVTDHINAFSLGISFLPAADNDFTSLYRLPRAGVAFYTGNLSNNAIYGRAYSFYPYLTIPVTSPMNKLVWNIRFGQGISWLTKKFDTENNWKNTAIGTHLNIHVHLGTGLQYRLTPNMEIFSWLTFVHVSNARIKSPNLGLNMVGNKTGLSYAIKPFPVSYVPWKKNKNIKNWSGLVSLSGGTKTRNHFDNNRYYGLMLALDLRRHFSPVNAMTFGTDLFFDNSLSEELRIMENRTRTSLGDLFRGGIHMGYEANYMNTTFVFQAGYYVYNHYFDITRIYNRVGFRYALFENTGLSILLRSHNFKADFMEFGLTYRWQ